METHLRLTRGSLLNRVTALLHATTAESLVTKMKQIHFYLPFERQIEIPARLFSDNTVVKCSEMTWEACVLQPSGVNINRRRVFINCETFCLKKFMGTESFQVLKKIQNSRPMPCNSCLCTHYDFAVFTIIERKAVNFSVRETLDIAEQPWRHQLSGTCDTSSWLCRTH